MSSNDKYKDIRTREAAPLASSLVESLRDLGYTPETAISDIIDNAIFAGAKHVWIDFEWNSIHSRIIVRDDGSGMNEEELAQAMRPGSQNPNEERAPNDLGRFGLGLKTASFSQCRVFTVISKKENTPITTWRWDLDYIVNDNGGWNILEFAEEKDIKVMDQMKAGTMIVWENLDRIVGAINILNSEDDFFAVAEKVKRHIEMVFHKYIENGRLKIVFNGYEVKPWDPFLRGETATQPFPEETLAEGQVVVKAYILPHRSKIDPEVWVDGENRGGWDALQGFYIYRNERLLLAADWLGFTRKKSHYKLTRIMINLPNHLDNEWQIDIKKSRARPPAYLRQDLRAIALTAMSHAEQIFRHRGKEMQRSLPGEFSFVWSEVVKNDRYFFRINRGHPVIAQQIAKLSGKKRELEKLLRIIEETVPGPAIITKENEYPDSMVRPYEETPSEELTNVMIELFEGWIKNGASNAEARKKLLITEPFSDYPQYIEALRDE
ncbi:ATP-binding protein [Aquimarina sp. 2201CG1-2-11]|uniref:ATP-binding protein n=1 Tax=Aquimarina discodermiae TaxID=3231043 RepID=UPI0034624921